MLSDLQGPRNGAAWAVRVDALCTNSLPSELLDGGGADSASLEGHVHSKAADREPFLQQGRTVQQAEKPAGSSSLPADVLDAIERQDPTVVIEDPNNVLIRECWRMRKQQSSKKGGDEANTTLVLVGVRTLQ